MPAAEEGYALVCLEGHGRFSHVPLHQGDTVSSLLDRACSKNFALWGVLAAQVDLHLVAPGSEVEEPSEDTLAAAVQTGRLGVGLPLLRAGVTSGSWLLARVVPALQQPAAALAGGSSSSSSSSDSVALSESARFTAAVERLEDVLRGSLSERDRLVFAGVEFDSVRRILVLGLCTPQMAKDALARVRQALTTRACRRLSATSGFFFYGALADGTGRPCTVHAVVTPSGALGAAKVYYAIHAMAAALEARVSKQLSTLAASRADLQGLRHCAVCYDAASPLAIGNGRLALIMPLFPRTLQQLAFKVPSHLPLPLPLLLRLLADVLGALVLLHATGLAHCDVKADNVMLTLEGRAVLIDLASATPFGEGMQEGLPLELRLGCEGAAAPQQDANGLACMLWALLHGGSWPLSGSTPQSLAAMLVAEEGGGEGQGASGSGGCEGSGAARRALMALLTGSPLTQILADVQRALA